MNLLTRHSTPSSEGTGLFCRIPWPEFSRAPWIIHPTHLSWFAVRFAITKLRRFSWQHGLNSSSIATLGFTSQPNEARVYLCFSLLAYTGISNTQPVYPSTSLLRAYMQVRELLTRFPSATPFSLALGADLPREDYLYPGNLGFTANRFLTCFIVTHVSIITSLSSSKLHSSPSLQ